MRPLSARAIGSAIALCALSIVPVEAEPAPDAATLLFEEPQLARTQPGDVLSYVYSRQSSDPAQFGPSFDDTVRLTIDKGTSEATRTVEAQMFSGSHRRAAGPFGDMTGNPLLSLILEQNIESLSAELGGNPRYFKTAIRAALRSDASVVAQRFEVGGHALPGWRVTIAPFKSDPNMARMKGLDALTYEFDVSPEVPGQIVEIRIGNRPGSGPLLVEEKVSYVAATH